MAKEPYTTKGRTGRVPQVGEILSGSERVLNLHALRRPPHWGADVRYAC